MCSGRYHIMEEDCSTTEFPGAFLEMWTQSRDFCNWTLFAPVRGPAVLCVRVLGLPATRHSAPCSVHGTSEPSG